MGLNRHELRERVFKLLFRVEFNEPEEMPEQVRLFLADEDTGAVSDDATYIERKYQAVLDRIPELDKIINDNTTGWTTSRMVKVELTVLRLAVFEMRYDDDIPEGVAIDEAVELAKTFGQENAGGFVNAILTKVKNAGSTSGQEAPAKDTDKDTNA